MRSLWRRLALQWLGGKGSGALTEESAVLDMMFAEPARVTDVFYVKRAVGVSHRAVVSSSDKERSETETASEPASHSGPPGRYPH
jgi:hypothetical protein